MPTADTLTQTKDQTLLSQLLERITFILILLGALIIPLAINPFNNESQETSKFFLFIFLSALTILLWALRGIIARKLQLNLSFLQVPFLLFLAAVLFSSLYSLNRFSSFWGGTGVWHLNFWEILSAFLFSLMVATAIRSLRQLQAIIIGFLLSIGLADLVALITFSPLYKNGIILTGSTNSLILLSLISLIINLISLFFLYRENRLKSLTTPVFGFLSIINLVTLVYLLSAFLPSNPLKAPTDLQLDWHSSWIIATNTLQNYPLFGTGPGTFSIDFTRFRPVDFNLTALWSLSFLKAGSELFTLLATIGIAGSLSFLLLAVSLIKTIIRYFGARSDSKDWSLGTALILILLSLILTNFSLSTFFVFSLFFGLYLAHKNLKAESETAARRSLSFSAIRDYLSGQFGAGSSPAPDNSRIELMPYVFGLLSLLFFGVTAVVFGKTYLAQNLYQQSIRLINEQKNNEAVSALSGAINLVPQLDIYHSRLSQLYLAQANELAAKKTLSDQEKTLLQNYLSQAVREIKLTTEKLNPSSATNWTIQAHIYQSLAGILPENAKADDPSVQNQLTVINLSINAYNQAIALDPNNPQLLLDLGGLLYSQRSYPAAEKYFTDAVNLKPNLPNAYYNLAFAYKSQNKNSEAVTALQNTLSLLAKDSTDYGKTQKELEDLQKLVTPTPTPTPATKP